MKTSKNKTRKLEFLLWVSWRYHEYRAAFFERLHLFVSAVSAVFSTAAVVALLPSDQSSSLALWAAAIVAIAQTLNTVVGFVRRARLHHELRNSFATLYERAAKLESLIGNPRWQREYDSLLRDKLRIDIQAPQALNSILAKCTNEYADSVGSRDPRLKLSWLHKTAGWLIQLPVPVAKSVRGAEGVLAPPSGGSGGPAPQVSDVEASDEDLTPAPEQEQVPR